MVGEVVENRLADDSCLFCGLAGGHFFRGKRNKYGNVDTEEGGVVIELSSCKIQICPDCAGKIRRAGIEL